MTNQPSEIQGQDPVATLKELAEISGSKDIAGDYLSAADLEARRVQLGHDIEILLALEKRREGQDNSKTIH
jgi:hypothetical protein